MKKLILTLGFALMSINPIFSCDEEGITGFVEENDLWIDHTTKTDGGITEKEFNEVIDDIEKLYKPIFREQRRKLIIKRKWKNGTVNAYANRSWLGFGRTSYVNMFGGLARHEAITKGGFAMVLCHELGHHIAGAPKVSFWASNEGQADYFASMKCLKRLYESDDNMKIISKMRIPKVVKSKCKKVYGDDNEDYAMCVRSAKAGESLALLFKDLRKLKSAPKFSTPDKKKVSSTFDKHPDPQCRLDTYFQGALCDKSYKEPVDLGGDLNQGVCTRSNGYEMGLRPLCWFKPSK